MCSSSVRTGVGAAQGGRRAPAPGRVAWGWPPRALAGSRGREACGPWRAGAARATCARPQPRRHCWEPARTWKQRPPGACTHARRAVGAAGSSAASAGGRLPRSARPGTPPSSEGSVRSSSRGQGHRQPRRVKEARQKAYAVQLHLREILEHGSSAVTGSRPAVAGWGQHLSAGDFGAMGAPAPTAGVAAGGSGCQSVARCVLRVCVRRVSRAPPHRVAVGAVTLSPLPA